MIERIENTELFLYNGSVVKRDELIAQRDRFRDIISGNEAILSSQKLIDCTNLQGDLLEAAYMFNQKKQEEIDKLESEIHHFTVEISNIEKWL